MCLTINGLPPSDAPNTWASLLFQYYHLDFRYSATSLHLLVNGPIKHSIAYTTFLYVLLIAAYYVWDTSNCQKSVFKAQKAGTWDPHRWRAPPQLPWAILKKPRTIGDGRLLVDGWWRFARKVFFFSCAYDSGKAMSMKLVTITVRKLL
jgi:Delta24(24(1))-sterol reductase